MVIGKNQTVGQLLCMPISYFGLMWLDTKTQTQTYLFFFQKILPFFSQSFDKASKQYIREVF
jgi:hypothetical protein